ncbi:MAG: hypothetical protein JWN70_5330 [Planctomycetaceae bacterium]|nr:hypothetical protein [Planctomycetaceae bacterium]
MPGERAECRRCAAIQARSDTLQKQQKEGRPNAVPSSLRPYLNRARLFATVTMGRSSGSRIGLLATPSRRQLPEVVYVAFVPGYSGGTATESNRLPYSLAKISRFRQAPISRTKSTASDPQNQPIGELADIFRIFPVRLTSPHEPKRETILCERNGASHRFCASISLEEPAASAVPLTSSTTK